MTRGEVEQRPILIVAPVGLLRNWEREIDEHLLDPGLGIGQSLRLAPTVRSL